MEVKIKVQIFRIKKEFLLEVFILFLWLLKGCTWEDHFLHTHRRSGKYRK